MRPRVEWGVTGETRQAVTLVVLAGGEGRRMGRAKAEMVLAGEPALARLLRRLAWAAGPTLLVTAPGRERPPGHELFDAEASDPDFGRGPLRGLLTAAEHAATDAAVVAAVDMPEVTTPALLWLARRRRELDAALLMTRRDEIEPLPMALHLLRMTPILRDRLAANDSLRGLADCDGGVVEAAPADWPAALWTNLNRPEDVERYATQE